MQEIKGKIKKYDREKAFGWLEVENDVKLRFFHISQWESTSVPTVGQIVVFRDGFDMKRRPQALKVTPIESTVVKATESSNAGGR